MLEFPECADVAEAEVEWPVLEFAFPDVDEPDVDGLQQPQPPQVDQSLKDPPPHFHTSTAHCRLADTEQGAVPPELQV